MVVDEGWKSVGIAAEILARIMEKAFYDLDAPVARVCTREVPIPYAKHLEEAAMPQVPQIVRAARGVMRACLSSACHRSAPTWSPAVLVEWLVDPGQAVKRGQVVAVVETQKGAVEVEIWDDGVVDELKVAPGTQGPGRRAARHVASAAARVRQLSRLPASRPHRWPSRRSPCSRRCTACAASAVARGKSLARCAASAEQLGVDLSQVAAETASWRRATCGPAPDWSAAAVLRRRNRLLRRRQHRTDKQAAMRQAIAAAMAKSKREIPHYYLGTTIDVSRALDGLDQQNAGRSVEGARAVRRRAAEGSGQRAAGDPGAQRLLGRRRYSSRRRRCIWASALRCAAAA